jgi:hypothetical protein
VAIAVDFVSFGADLWMGGGSVPGGLYTPSRSRRERLQDPTQTCNLKMVLKNIQKCVHCQVACAC